jgi:hypothetical protein
MKMARLFSNIEYIDVALAYGEVCGSALRAQRISVRLLVGVHEGLGIFGPNCTIEVLRERVQRVENTATIIRKRYAGKSGRTISLAPSLLY